MSVLTFILMMMSATADDNIDYVDIKKGFHAPFSGKLLTNEALAKILATHEAEIKQLELDLKYKNNINDLQNKLNYSIKISQLETQNNYLKQTNELKNKQIDKFKKTNKHNQLYTYASFFAGAITSIAIFYSVK
jgi:hypothetical protein